MSANKITPFLWFNGNAVEAIDFYLSVFKDKARKGDTIPYGQNEYGKEGEPMTIEFSVMDQDFIAINAGDEFHFTEAVSFAINCDSQEEIDYYWDKLAADGGKTSVCGWLKDKYGLSWQVDSQQLEDMLKNGDAAQRSRVVQAMYKMTKLDIAALEKAYVG